MWGPRDSSRLHMASACITWAHMQRRFTGIVVTTHTLGFPRDVWHAQGPPSLGVPLQSEARWKGGTPHSRGVADGEGGTQHSRGVADGEGRDGSHSFITLGSPQGWGQASPREGAVGQRLLEMGAQGQRAATLRAVRMAEK